MSFVFYAGTINHDRYTKEKERSRYSHLLQAGQSGN